MLKLIAALTLALLPSAAWAQDDKYSDLDSDGKKGRPSKEEDDGKPAKEEVVREIERGLYGKASIGSATYLLNYGSKAGIGSILKSGTSLGMAFGSDFVDQERKSMAWEVAFMQGIHNGMNWEQNAALVSSGQLAPTSAVQGDTRSYGALAGIEYSAYPSRRLGIGIRAGGGVFLTPLLMDRAAFDQQVAEWGAGAPTVTSVHRTPHPLGYGGPTFEYYTKLSHFSIGADVDVMYVVGFDLGINGTGYMKYSF
jgi:hypothetical protein